MPLTILLKEKYMSNILISGCGISYSKQQKPSWVKVLQLCKVPVIDLGGPAVSNEYILNKLIKHLLEPNEKTSHVICQLTSLGKLDVEVNKERYKELVENDPLRNFTFDGVWPSSTSKLHPAKQTFYKWLYSERIDAENTLIKMYTLHKLCHDRNIKLLFLQGYDINWPSNAILEYMPIDINFVIENYYKSSDYYQHHDHAKQNTVPCIEFQKHLAFKINKEFLQFDLDAYYNKFKW